MSINLEPTSKMLIDRALNDAKLAVNNTFRGWTPGAANTTTVTRVVRAQNTSDSAKRGFTITVTVAETATAGVSALTPTTAMDDLSNP